MPEGNIRSHEALHNWSRLVNAALRPVTMTMLEAIEAPALRRWRGALHANNLDGERVPGAAGAPTEKVLVFSDRSVAIIRHAPKRASSTTVPLQPVPETEPMLVPTAPREPRRHR